MNLLQQFSRKLVAANSDTSDARDTALVWRGQTIEKVDTLWEDDEANERPFNWMDRAVNAD